MLNGTASLLPALTAVLLMAAVAAVLSRSNDSTAQASGGAAFGPLGGGLALAGLFAIAATILLPGLVHQVVPGVVGQVAPGERAQPRGADDRLPAHGSPHPVRHSRRGLDTGAAARWGRRR